MKFQHKLALILLGGILVVLAVFLIISFVTGDNTNDNHGGGPGVPQSIRAIR